MTRQVLNEFRYYETVQDFVFVFFFFFVILLLNFNFEDEIFYLVVDDVILAISVYTNSKYYYDKS